MPLLDVRSASQWRPLRVTWIDLLSFMPQQFCASFFTDVCIVLFLICVVPLFLCWASEDHVWGCSTDCKGNFRGTRLVLVSSATRLAISILLLLLNGFPSPVELLSSSFLRLLRLLSISSSSRWASSPLFVWISKICCLAEAQWSFLALCLNLLSWLLPRWPPLLVFVSLSTLRFFDCWFFTAQPVGLLGLRSFSVTCVDWKCMFYGGTTDRLADTAKPRLTLKRNVHSLFTPEEEELSTGL